ncbi:polysaccharide biosynthesis protein [Nocardia sp. NPDC020380]|uniref:polysaccharide biosynthesis protein n=1 Tax=Nocardia sp. NPDC020380 TaxID=3364309 RepID=UPI0037A9C339
MARVSVVRRLPVVADLTLVTAGAMTANIAGYLLQLLAGRWLGVSGYSPFASLLAVQLLCAVPALALQNVVAREIVRGAPVSAARRLATRCAALVALAAILLVPVVATVLKVGYLAAAGALVAAPALVLLSGEQGILQGRSRFRELAKVLGGAGIARVTPAVIVLAVGGGTAGALWAAALGVTAAAIAARRTADAAAMTTSESSVDPAVAEEAADLAGLAHTATHVTETPEARRGEPQPIETTGRIRAYFASVLPVFHAAQVQAALMALSSADLIVSRIVLGENDAGRYALGAIAAKIAFWLPQAVGVVLYPRMAQPQHSARAVRSALAVLIGVGAVAVAGAALAAPLASLFAGRDYAPIENLLWLFALDGALLAVLQGALLSAIATDRTAPAAITWLGLATGIAIMLTCAHSVTTLITIATITVAVTTTVITAIALRTAHSTGESASTIPDFDASGI